jgi:hypothetical protein
MLFAQDRKFLIACALCMLAIVAIGQFSNNPSTSLERFYCTSHKDGITERPVLGLDPGDPVDILLIMDNDYGANYHFIRSILESWGWNITTTALTPSITPCSYQSSTSIIDVDILLTSDLDLSLFDAISIMPGNSHTSLLASSVALDLIRSANNEGLVVSAWCKAVRILAYADIIDGLNVTGNVEYAADYASAGATYLGVVAPVIQGNIVTGVRSRYYREEMCIAIATALGVYETEPPDVSNVHFSPETQTSENYSILSAEVIDASNIGLVRAKLYQLDGSSMNRTDGNVIKSVNMVLSVNGSYVATFEDLSTGRYTVDIEVEDVFENEFTYTDAAVLTVSASALIDTSSLVLIISGAAIISVVGVLWMRRRNQVV